MSNFNRNEKRSCVLGETFYNVWHVSKSWLIWSGWEDAHVLVLQNLADVFKNDENHMGEGLRDRLTEITIEDVRRVSAVFFLRFARDFYNLNLGKEISKVYSILWKTNILFTIMYGVSCCFAEIVISLGSSICSLPWYVRVDNRTGWRPPPAIEDEVHPVSSFALPNSTWQRMLSRHIWACNSEVTAFNFLIDRSCQIHSDLPFKQKHHTSFAHLINLQHIRGWLRFHRELYGFHITDQENQSLHWKTYVLCTQLHLFVYPNI